MIDAEDRVLHRIRTRSMGFAAIGAVAALFFDWRAAVSLTIAAAVVIFSFLVFEKLTVRLVAPRERWKFRAILPLLLVTAAAVGLLLVVFRWKAFDPVAGAIGLSAVVLAIGGEIFERGNGG